MGELFDLSNHPAARQHIVAKQAALAKVKDDIEDLNFAVNLKNQDIDILKDDIKKLDRALSAIRRARRSKKADEALDALGFDKLVTGDNITPHRMKAKEMMQARRTQLRLEQTKLGRIMEAIRGKLDRKNTLMKEIERAQKKKG